MQREGLALNRRPDLVAQNAQMRQSTGQLERERDVSSGRESPIDIGVAFR